MSTDPLPSSAEAVVTEPLVAPAGEAVPPVTADAAPPATTPATGIAVAAERRSRARLVAGLRRFARFAIMLALLVGGAALGSRSFQASQPAPPVLGDPVTAGVPTPPVVTEFIAAFATNNADAIRSAVPAEPYKQLASELQRWDISTITSIQTLSTFEQAGHSSTAIVMIGRSSAGNVVTINLIIQESGGKIVSFR